MLDLTQILRDLESPSYGAMSHAVGTLMRVIRADGAVALTWDPRSKVQYAYVGSSGLALTPEQHQMLRKWPGTPRSIVWHQTGCPTKDQTCLFTHDIPAHTEPCREIAQAMTAAGIPANPTSLRLTLTHKPICVVLFLRRDDRAPFVPEDQDRLSRFTTHVSKVIQQGHHRELRRLGRSPDTHDPIATILPIEDLLGRLSATEHTVLQRLQKHDTERQIAEALDRSPNTIHVHVKSIYRKLMVTSRKQLLLLLDHGVKIAPVSTAATFPQDHPRMAG